MKNQKPKILVTGAAVAIAFTLSIFVPDNALAQKSSRAIPGLSQDSTSSNVVLSRDTGTAAPLANTSAKDAVYGSGSGIGGSAYMQNTERYAPGTAPTPLPMPPAPDPGASIAQIGQAIQMFMQFMGSQNQKQAAQQYSDYVDPNAVLSEGTAPPLPITGDVLDSECTGLAPEARKKMQDYIRHCGSSLSNENVVITDFSSITPIMYILRRSDMSMVGCSRVGYGSKSHGNPPIPGNGAQSHQTPGGFFVTKVHNGEAYQEWNSIGLRGLGSENAQTINRGVIMHPTNGHTWGCVGIPSKRFAVAKSQIGYGATVLHYFPGQATPSQSVCPRSGGQSSVPGNANPGANQDAVQ